MPQNLTGVPSSNTKRSPPIRTPPCFPAGDIQPAAHVDRAGFAACRRRGSRAGLQRIPVGADQRSNVALDGVLVRRQRRLAGEIEGQGHGRRAFGNLVGRKGDPQAVALQVEAAGGLDPTSDLAAVLELEGDLLDKFRAGPILPRLAGARGWEASMVCPP